MIKKITLRLGVVVSLLLTGFISSAQQVQRHIAIGAYIYNIAKNIEWQNEEKIQEFHFLVVGDDENITQELKNLSKAKSLRDKPIIISSITTFNKIGNAHLVFVLGGKSDVIPELYEQIEGQNILLVSENYNDKRLIMINFYDSSDGSLLFEMNKSNILNQNLRILPDVIFAGGTEIDVATLYKEGQHSLRKLQKQIETFESNLSQLESEIIKKATELELAKDSLAFQSKKIAEQQRRFENQNRLLDEKKLEIEVQIKKSYEQQRVLKVLSGDIEKQRNELITGKDLLELQQLQIKQQDSVIQSQTIVLKESGLTIHKQKNLMYLLVIIIILSVALFISLLTAYRNNRKHSKHLELKVAERTAELNTLNEQLRIELVERVSAEQKIQKLNETLEYRVNERTAQLEAINKELESYSYSISHDLRAPLRAIFGFSQILSRRHRESLNDEGRQYMDFIVQASVRMEHLINDLLDYSRLGRKSVDLYPISLKSVISNMHNDFKQRLDEINAKMIYDSNLPEVMGNESLLNQVFINLIGNAINYRRKEIPLEIRVSYESDEQNITVYFSDNGIGIPKEYWEKIFHIFQRLHSDDEYPGTGIGLATVRKSVNLMNGNIWVDSVVNKGTTFFIRMLKPK